jgi:hypothetical protein
MTIWTPEAIRALGPTTDLPTLSSIFDCSKWKAYEMARTGEWETIGVKIVRLGSKYRVIVPSILEVLGYPQGVVNGDGASDEAQPCVAEQPRQA